MADELSDVFPNGFNSRILTVFTTLVHWCGFLCGEKTNKQTNKQKNHKEDKRRNCLTTYPGHYPSYC